MVVGRSAWTVSDKMNAHPAPAVLRTVQIILVLILAVESHIIYPPFHRYPNLEYGAPEGPIGPHPLIPPYPQRHPFLTHDIPQFHHQPPLHEVTHHVPLVYTGRNPPPVLVVPLRGVFPPFIERIVQRIQTFWSVYNPPEVLTRPPADPPVTTTRKPINNKVTTSTTTTVIPEDEVDLEDEATLAPETAEDSVTSPSDLTSTRVSTLAVYEVTPTVAPETEEPMYITPERASVLGQKDVILRFLQTGQVPPHLQPDSVNEMDNMFENS